MMNLTFYKLQKRLERLLKKVSNYTEIQITYTTYYTDIKGSVKSRNTIDIVIGGSVEIKDLEKKTLKELSNILNKDYEELKKIYEEIKNEEN